MATEAGGWRRQNGEARCFVSHLRTAWSLIVDPDQRRRQQLNEAGHGPAFCEHKGTTAEESRAADRLCKNLEIWSRVWLPPSTAATGTQVI
jgi:hypothetical protein